MTNALEYLPFISPELALLFFSVFALLAGVYAYRTINTIYFAMVSAFLLFIVGATFVEIHDANTLLNDMLIVDGFSQLGKITLMIAALLVCYVSHPWLTKGEGKPFEYLVLVMLSVFGMMLLVSANDLLALYMAIELVSLSLYVLASFSRDDVRSSEAGLKYFVLGALASGIMLYGITFIYGFTGTTSYTELRGYFAATGGEGYAAINQITLVGMVLVIIGFCFKVSAVPFHMWTPDVYEGAPTPVTTYFAVVPKVAVMLAFTRLLFQPFEELLPYWQQIIIFAAIGSLLVGALGALMQTNIKRLLAYSSIGHVGFMLIALATGINVGAQAIFVYLAIYVFMSAGAFGCVMMLRNEGEPVLAIEKLKGLSHSQPVMAACIAIFMFSMAGIPPLAGFFGKMYVVLAAVNNGLVWLAAVGVLISVIACFYYIRIVKLMYFDEADEAITLETSLAIKAAVGICAVVTLLFVLLPTPLVNYAQNAAETLLP